MKKTEEKLGKRIGRAMTRTVLFFFLALVAGCASIATASHPESKFLTQLLGGGFFVFLFLSIGFGWRWESLKDKKNLQDKDYREEWIANDRSRNAVLWMIVVMALLLMATPFATDADAPWKNPWWSLFAIGIILCFAKTFSMAFRDCPKKTK